VYHCGEGYTGTAQGTVGDCKGVIADAVVYDLMPVENTYRVGLGGAVISIPRIRSSGRIKAAAFPGRNLGLSMAGMPSLGGPPERISSACIRELERSNPFFDQALDVMLSIITIRSGKMKRCRIEAVDMGLLQFAC